MELAELIQPAGIIANLRVTSKKQALQELSKRAAELTGQGERAIFEGLIERERLGTTGVGHGIGIPHGKLPDLDRLYGLFARLEMPIDFDAIDKAYLDAAVHEFRNQAVFQFYRRRAMHTAAEMCMTLAEAVGTACEGLEAYEEHRELPAWQVRNVPNYGNPEPHEDNETESE